MTDETVSKPIEELTTATIVTALGDCYSLWAKGDRTTVTSKLLIYNNK